MVHVTEPRAVSKEGEERKTLLQKKGGTADLFRPLQFCKGRFLM